MFFSEEAAQRPRLKLLPRTVKVRYRVAGDTVFVQLAPLSFVVVVGAPGMGYGEGANRAITPHMGAVASPFRISIRETYKLILSKIEIFEVEKSMTSL